MPRPTRKNVGGVIYHVLNRRAGGGTLFESDADYLAFEKVLAEAVERFKMRLLAYCLLSTHWHLILWPARDADLSRFMQWLTVTHMRRWHAHRRSTGTGPVYQGRFKSFPVQDDHHFLTVTRYVERNALRAKIVKHAQAWRWCSLAARDSERAPEWLLSMNDWPTGVRRNWVELVNQPQTDRELDAIRESIRRGRPFGSPPWVERTAARLKLESSLRNPWRPCRNITAPTRSKPPHRKS